MKCNAQETRLQKASVRKPMPPRDALDQARVLDHQAAPGVEDGVQVLSIGLLRLPLGEGFVEELASGAGGES